MPRYDYERYEGYPDLLRAVEENETAENTNALAQWFESFGSQYWNGECYDMGGGKALYPIYKQIDEDEFEIVGYEIH